ncbi:MAG: sulfatase-like hydrolase/transferase [Eisenbergiella sp.]
MGERRNVILIYADDLGFGDLGCYGSSRVETPNVDRLCREGLKFYNAYSASAVCTPSRYSILTGRYPFRNDRAHILPGDAQCIIEPGTKTLAGLFGEAGYRTGIVGKWHLGLSDGSAPIDWNREINVTPLDLGFDESFIFPATADRVPCVYVDGRKVAGLEADDPIFVSYEQECPFDDIPTYHKNPELLKMESSHGHDCSLINGIGRIGYMKGGKKARWKDEELAEAF